MNSILAEKSRTFRYFSAEHHNVHVYFWAFPIALYIRGHLEVVSNVLPKALMPSLVHMQTYFRYDFPFSRKLIPYCSNHFSIVAQKLLLRPMGISSSFPITLMAVNKAASIR